jgi:hypothetical protein
MLKNMPSYTSTPPYAVIAWCFTQYSENFCSRDALADSNFRLPGGEYGDYRLLGYEAV